MFLKTIIRAASEIARRKVLLEYLKKQTSGVVGSYLALYVLKSSEYKCGANRMVGAQTPTPWLR